MSTSPLNFAGLDPFNVSSLIDRNNYTELYINRYIDTVSSYFRGLIALSNVIRQAKLSSILKPFEHISDEERFYRLYLQPILFLIALVAFMAMTVYTRKDKSFKSYVLTVTYLLNDTINILLPLPFHIAYLPSAPNNDGLSSQWCELFRVLVAFLPQALYYHSQWLKFVACIFECLSVYNPPRAEWLYRKRFLTTLLVVSLLLATAISSLMHYDVDFERFWYVNDESEIIKTCIMVPSAIYDVESRSYNMIRIVAPMTIGIIVPFVCMIFAVSLLTAEIFTCSKIPAKKSTKQLSFFRRQHSIFVVISTIFFISLLLPRLAFEIMLVDQIYWVNFSGLLTRRLFLVSQILYHLTVPTTILIYYSVKRRMSRKSPKSVPVEYKDPLPFQDSISTKE